MQNTMGRALIFILGLAFAIYVFRAPLADQNDGVEGMALVFEMPKMREDALGTPASINPIIADYGIDAKGAANVTLAVELLDATGMSITSEGRLQAWLTPSMSDAEIAALEKPVPPIIGKRFLGAPAFQLRKGTGGAKPAVWYSNLPMLLPDGPSASGYDVQVEWNPIGGAEEDGVVLEIKGLMPTPHTPKEPAP